MRDLKKLLEKFASENGMIGKGQLCVALVVTRQAKTDGLPLDPDTLVTENKGQVAGLGKASVQAILKDHGIVQVLAEEGGRTSRGSIGNMRSYVAFLNDLEKKGAADLKYIEDWWISQVRLFFCAKPFILKFDTSKSIQSIIDDLISQAEKRQRDGMGMMYVGTLLQHLVGAKLDIIMGGIEHHGAAVKDEGKGKDSDFVIADVAIHVTTTPSEALIRKCARNLDSGRRPIIISTQKGVVLAKALADQTPVADRIDILDVDQFFAGNLYEHGRFEVDGRRMWAVRLIERYNEIIKISETDPSLRISFGK
jgi:hypothetical protein